ncbi:MAG: PQQ-dependent sugar dehydrogenase [Proteobacteria bacterium]|nr:PQQ-dependent sugar dehydrogenase [Pseudomonadota bacterium]
MLILLQILCALGLALGVVLFLPVSLRSLSGELRNFTLLLGAGYLLCAGLLIWRERSRRPPGFETLVSSFALGFLPATLYALHIHDSVPNKLLFAELLWGGVLATVTVALRRQPALRLGLLAILGVLGLVLPIARHTEPHVVPAVRVWRLDTALYGLEVTEYRKLISPSPATGGAVAAFRDDFVVVNGVGDLFLLSRDPATHELKSQQLKPSVPINWHDFEHTFGQVEDVTYFRTADVLVQELGAKVRLFASHHYWKAEQKCFVVRVSMLETDSDRLAQADTGAATWKTIFESTPCIALDTAGPLMHFGGIQIGGRMGLLSPTELLLAVGDHEHDGVNNPDRLPQDDVSSYGKTILINLTDFSHQQFSKGHRNPQGLFVDGPEAIWETEHGPQGGDELNFIKRGANYGWPSVSYGTEYGAHFWPGDPTPGSHEGYSEPFYSWVPSIGVSSLLVLHGPEFKLWAGDVLIVSLRDGALYRARVRDQRIVMMERMPFGRRLRDIAEGSHGHLLMWTDRGAILDVEVDSGVGGGETVFKACNGCHVIGDGESNGIGPDLRKVVGRKVANMAGFRYSPAMQNLGGKWTRERLDQFLTDPQAYVPGTKMRFPGIADAAQRHDLIEFLASGANNKPPPEDPVD